MKPFNLERALAGDPVITREGKPVHQLTQFNVAEDNPYSVGGVVNGLIQTWTTTGAVYCNKAENPDDLFMANVKCTGWVNIYPCHNYFPSVNIYPNRAKADEAAGPNRIACVKLEWEE